jgi:hypothetical protein
MMTDLLGNKSAFLIQEKKKKKKKLQNNHSDLSSEKLKMTPMYQV